MSNRISRRLARMLANRWRKMIARCENPAHADYRRYGARGIRVCPQWRDPLAGLQAFAEFVVNQLPRPDGMTIEAVLAARGREALSLDRIDNDGHYQPGNLRFATPMQQSANQRRTAIVDLNGTPVARSHAARMFGVDPRTAARRQRCGYTGLEAVTLGTGGRTCEPRRWRDEIILAMISMGDLAVDADGFVFVRNRDGWHLPPVGKSGGGRYHGVSITVPPQFVHLVPVDERARSAFRSLFQHSRVVALFHHPLPDRERYYEVDHVNMNTMDDHPGNLRWRAPDDNRSDAHRDRAAAYREVIRYDDPALQEAALQAFVAARATASSLPDLVEEPALPANLNGSVLDEYVALVKADPRYAESIWSDPRYASLLPAVLTATANHCTRLGERVVIDCRRQVGDAVVTVSVVNLRTSDRVYVACAACGRQAFKLATEVRNRLRYARTPCQSCHALDRHRPDLAALLAPHPVTGVKRHGSRVTVGSNNAMPFRCRVAGCPRIVLRQVKTLVRDGELPVCEVHRRRGRNFARSVRGRHRRAVRGT